MRLRVWGGQNLTRILRCILITNLRIEAQALSSHGSIMFQSSSAHLPHGTLCWILSPVLSFAFVRSRWNSRCVCF